MLQTLREQRPNQPFAPMLNYVAGLDMLAQRR